MISDKLYERAFEFKKTKLWDVLWGYQFFAVKLSDNRIGYVRMVKAPEGVNALELYIGEEGLESLWTMVKLETFQLAPNEYMEALIQRSCLQCAMMGKDALTDELREEVRAFARSHGIRLAGKNAYPQFTKFLPYYSPWHLQTEEEQESLCEALEAALEMARLLKGKTPQEIGLNSLNSEARETILLERRGDVYILGKTELTPAEEKKWPVPEICNDISIAKLKKLKRSGIWECGFIRIPEPVQDEEEIPLYPIILFVINSATEYILPLPLVVHYEDQPEGLMNVFMETLLEENICPGEIRVKDSRTLAFFKPFCEKLKVPMTEEEYLPALENAEATFYEDFGMDRDEEFYDGDMGDEEVLEGFAGMLEMLLKLNDGQQLQVPEEMKSQLKVLQENGNLPKSLEDKLNQLIGSAGTGELKSGNAHSKERGRLKLVSNDSQIIEEAKGKSFVISVSLGVGCYRHIQISCNALLLELHFAIIDAFGFDDDHAHAFFMDDRLWSDWDSYYMEGVESDLRATNKYRLSQAGLGKGKKFKYIFDFGDEWVFQCKVLRVVEKVSLKPAVIKSKGEAPEQYPDWDDDWSDE